MSGGTLSGAPERLAWFQLAEAAGVWDIDELERRCPYCLLYEWQEYMIFIARCRSGEIDTVRIKLSGKDLMMALAGAFGAEIRYV